MKIPRFTLGMIAGVILSTTLVTSSYYLLKFRVADGIHQSISIPFYLTKDDTNYENYQRLEDPGFWLSLSNTAQSEAEVYCRKNNILADISVRCLGSPQEYIIYYSTGEYTSFHDVLNRNKIESVIVEHVDSKYKELLSPIFKTRGEQVAPRNR